MSDMTTQKPTPARRSRSLRPSLRAVWSAGSPLSAVRAIEASLAVGRAEDEGVWRFEDPALSRRHAELLAAGEQARVRDTSSGGTYVNGSRVDGELALADGDVLRMGDTFFVFRRDDAAVADAPLPSLVGMSPAIRRLRGQLAALAATDTLVLLLGETGTGKEVAARVLHDRSGRTGAFVAVNSSAIPESLAETQLFGHVRGAFTGARTNEPGLFRAAEGGTILLDEIGELPLALQAKLLRALEERAVCPVGSTRAVPFDARVIAATNKNLLGAIQTGAFRADLYARIAEIVVELPPLAARREDVVPLVLHALGAPAMLSPALVERLLLHPWPFNVREVVKLGKRLSLHLGGGELLDTDLLGHDLDPLPTARPVEEPKEERRERPSREELERLLTEHAGVVADVARSLDRSARQVYRWLDRYGIDPDAFRPAAER
jgi:transcriptional regulator with PAS, ATPase and Fis domain